MKRSSWSIALYVVLIFASGVAAGVLGQRLLASNVVSAATSPRSPEQWRAKYVSELRQRLALDHPQETKVNEVLDVMVELAQEGMTMMCVTHEMGFAKKVADRIIFMEKGGAILEDCTKDEFFGSPRKQRTQDFLSKILHN